VGANYVLEKLPDVSGPGLVEAERYSQMALVPNIFYTIACWVPLLNPVLGLIFFGNAPTLWKALDLLQCGSDAPKYTAPQLELSTDAKRAVVQETFGTGAI